MSDNKDMRAVLFRNDKKSAETHADYRGQATVAGKEYWLDAWVNDGKTGKYLSVKFKPREKPAAKQDAFASELDMDVHF